MFSYLGHVMRKESLENFTLTGRVAGEKRKGRPRVKYLTGLTSWMLEFVPEGQRRGNEITRFAKKNKRTYAMESYESFEVHAMKREKKRFIVLLVYCLNVC